MKNLILTTLTAIAISVSVQAGPEPQPTPVVLDQSTLGSFVESVVSAKSLTILAYPTYAPKLNNGAWGMGLAAMYPISQYVFAGLRLDALDGNYYAASATASLKTDIKINKFTFTPFATAGVNSPISGAGSKNQSVGATAGGGVFVPIKQFMDKHLTLGAFGSFEYWSQYGDIAILHAGLVGKYDF